MGSDDFCSFFFFHQNICQRAEVIINDLFSRVEMDADVEIWLEWNGCSEQ